MKLRQLIYIFVIGLVCGIVVSPLISENPSKILLSPISPSLAQTREFLSPVSEEQILGAQTEPKDNQVLEEKESKFADLIKQDELVEDKESKAEKPVAESSDYSGKITVAVFGDSMVDLMGTNLPYLKKSLSYYYPKAELILLNYGIGAQNIEQGIERLNTDHNYKDRHYPPILNSNADIIVLESFAYNPIEKNPEELDRHRSDLANLVDKLKASKSSRVVILATIAPSLSKFGQGADGVNWPENTAKEHAERIIKLLDNTTRFAKSVELPLADVFHSSLNLKGDGNVFFINSNDHIHQSESGNKLIADILAKTIYNILPLKV